MDYDKFRNWKLNNIKTISSEKNTTLSTKNNPTQGREENNTNTGNDITKKTIKEYYFSEDHEVYLIEFVGDIQSRINKLPYADLFYMGSFFAYLFVENGKLNDLLKDVPEIINIQKGFPYTLSDLKNSNNLYSNKTLDMGTTNLQGIGVTVGIISTGIDYLNPRFMNPDGSSRIVGIWDETLNEDIPPKNFFRGTEFNKEDIDEALRIRALGGNPYTIVNHMDEVGHGTAIAGIIGGRNLGQGDGFISAVPRCNFAVVKLKEAKRNILALSGIDNVDIGVYQDSDIEAGIRYLEDLQKRIRTPMVVYVALGSNSGGHNGATVLERYMNFAAEKRDFAMVCNTGNQGDAGGHASGNFTRNGEQRFIPFNVNPVEGNLFFSVYALKPDKITVGLISPTGEGIEVLTVPKVNGESVNETLGNSNITIQYFEEKESGGDQRIDVLIRNIQGGIWQINLNAQYVIKGRYDIWLLQKELLKPGTRFLQPDESTTLMTPSTAQNALVTSYYNQVDNSMILESGRGFTRAGSIKPSITMGAMDLLTAGLNDRLRVASGAALAGALLTGAVAMIYQWGLVEGNDMSLYPPKLLSYVISATLREEGGIYPNEQWGYGRFSFRKLVDNLNRIKSENLRLNPCKALEERNLYLNIPFEVYRRLKT
ncbi:S8 family peptidase [Clostridium sp.]|uniref:S8 family peptidase n=1 Tax=Clostridium sp. TaxID=1506 RepID=UPI002FCA39BE